MESFLQGMQSYSGYLPSLGDECETSIVVYFSESQEIVQGPTVAAAVKFYPEVCSIGNFIAADDAFLYEGFVDTRVKGKIIRCVI